MSRFNKVRFISIVIGVSFLLVLVLETKVRDILLWTPWNQSFALDILNISRFSTKTIDKRLCLCVSFKGRLGNQMFIYASAYGISRTKNRRLITAKSPLWKIFEGVSTDGSQSECDFLLPYKEKRACAFDHQTLEFKADRGVFLEGYLQSWIYFKNHSADIRRIFTFRKPILTDAKDILEGIKRQYLRESDIDGRNLTLVGVHVRRGDMVDEDLMKVGYRTATSEYYFRAMDYFRRRFNNTLFVVCSDDIAWCRKNLKLDKNIKIASGGSPSVDMAILSLCNHTISSSGSFSWWSAWLAGGVTTHFAHPAAEGTHLRKLFSKNYTDYFWPGWIALT